jgi:predicted dehydrogenase
VFEGRKIVEAARKYKCVVQHGTQSRSSDNWAKMTAAARSGKYGKLLVSKGYCCKPRWSIGFKPWETPPAHLDFNLWLGPANLQPYHGNLVHYNWHWFWDFGNGDMGNQGVHQMDLARWGVKDGTLPKSVVSLGGRYVNEPGFHDQGETPNQIVSIFDYGDSLLLFETRGLVGKVKGFGSMVTNEFYTENGVIKNGKFFPKGSGSGESLDVEAHVQPGGPFRNFITCVRSRKHADLNADVLEGHLSSALCHLGNISYRMGVERKFEKPKDLGDNEVVGASIMTMLENTKAIGVNVENAMLRVGPKLAFDPAKEKFVDNPAADMLLTRPYREPFVVTEKV